LNKSLSKVNKLLSKVNKLSSSLNAVSPAYLVLFSKLDAETDGKVVKISAKS
jgi:hypothetical protein